MIQGIPYFGIDTQSIYEHILDSSHTNAENVTYSSMYELIMDNINKRVVVVVNNKWLTWLNDIVFNYRDKECYIPYYTYSIHTINDRKYKTNDKGHLILNDGTLSFRYNYKLEKLYVGVNNCKLDIVNIDTLERKEVSTSCWISEKEFDIDKLYELYINSAFNEDDLIFNKHRGGYHYIGISPREFSNREKNYTELYGLNIWNTKNYFEHDYRDVRNFKYDEIISKCNIIPSTEPLFIRRLKFEAYLYCILRQEIPSNNKEFNTEMCKLKNGKRIVKYGDTVKLIIKNYWFNNIERNTSPTWSRM